VNVLPERHPELLADTVMGSGVHRDRLIAIVEPGALGHGIAREYGHGD
jgi:hypothetical protein